jgi:hypothetical protein
MSKSPDWQLRMSQDSVSLLRMSVQSCKSSFVPDEILEVDAGPLGLILQPLGHRRQDIRTGKNNKTLYVLFLLNSFLFSLYLL